MLHFMDESFTAPDDSPSNLNELVSREHTAQNNVELDASSEDFNRSEREATPSSRTIGAKQHIEFKKRKLLINESLHSQAKETTVETSKIDKNREVKKINYSVEHNDAIETFAKFVADELRSIRDASNDGVTRQVKRKIQQVILQTWDLVDGSPQPPTKD
ncbi:uncharacterized protein [Halyomorpha halys]|uniref:uncharacterized protein n=1 Tax=Halyomorpha halys TaxID=286706 RepID=UPI0006D4DECB|nr:uncharacterized protein LOC106682139 [Halyomorpha halys]XP_014278325.1 uncharacterized protein LOC106682139 [Halyomorpha halys]XP_024220115.1 uncharacterized protein LOC106682139 [Halyomorpha halys]